jgi:primosomal protein N' (replication factor Y)
MYADVAVCLPLSRTFVYKIGEPVEIGCRVVVPFRKRDREGFVVGVRNEVLDDIEIHPITNIIDQSPLLRPEVFRLCRWISEYYVSPLGEVLKAALPPGMSEKHLGKPVGTVGEALAPRLPALQLTADQSRAFEAIRNTQGFHTLLLHGVTGSGKTEVYMRAAEHFMAAGKSSLILIPEIALTPQLTDRFSQRFPRRIAILHSSLTKRQRIDEWLRIYAGEASIVIGTRSAVFAPLENLGLIVVDEEHETTYKQD